MDITIIAIILAAATTIGAVLYSFLKDWLNINKSRNIKITTQTGDKTLELEYSPTKINEEELIKLIDILSKQMENDNVEADNHE